MTTHTNNNPEDFTTRHVGELFDSNLDIVEVAKLVRKALKGAGLRASVRVQRYSMGQCLNIAISEVTSVALKAELTRTAMKHADEIANIPGSRDFESCYRYAAECLASSFATAYQRSESDSHTDYYSANFSTNATFRAN
jgi:hypothetical protein